MEGLIRSTDQVKRDIPMPVNLSLTEALAFMMTRIECESPLGISTGTGFYYAFQVRGNHAIPVLITNRHVVEGSTIARLWVHLSRSPNDLPDTHTKIEIDEFEKIWIPHPDSTVDLCITPIAPYLKRLDRKDGMPFLRCMEQKLIANADYMSNLAALEEVVMVGYPNGLWDDVNNMPIFRRGVTATHPKNDWRGKKEFMIDAACFPGSSGSPVMLHNTGQFSPKSGVTVIGGSRFMFLGVLYAGPQHMATGEIAIMNLPTTPRPVAVSPIPNNLGIVIKAERILEFNPIIEELAASHPQVDPIAEGR